MKLASVVLLALFASGTTAAPAHKNLVVSESSPALALEIAPEFRELLPLRFPIGNQTNAERRIFVEANADHVVKRLVIVQFEDVQDGSDFRFVYPSTPPRQFGKETYRSGTFVYNDERAAQSAPDKEAGRTRAFLAGAGLVPAKLYRTTRLARVSDPRGSPR